MADDLIFSLRCAAAFAGPNAQKLYLDAAQEIERQAKFIEAAWLAHPNLDMDIEYHKKEPKSDG